MANQPIPQDAVGLQQAFVSVFPVPIPARRAPTSRDTGYQLGQVWLFNGTAYMLVSVAAGQATWTIITNSGGSGAFSTLSSTGNTSLANSATATSADILNGAITGAATLSILTANTAPATVNVATSAQANVVTIGSQTGAAATTIQSGTGNILLDSAASNVRVVANTVTAAGNTVANAARVGKCIYTGLTTASAATVQIVISNANIDTTSVLVVTVGNTGANDAQMTLTRLQLAGGAAQLTLTNNGTQALNGDIFVSYWLMD